MSAILLATSLAQESTCICFRDAFVTLKVFFFNHKVLDLLTDGMLVLTLQLAIACLTS
jgi:hypothetical protein